MKKTLITLLALSGIASAAIELTAITNKGGTHLTDKNASGELLQLWDESGSTRDGNKGLANVANTLSKIQTVGNDEFNLKFASAISFTIIEDLHFYKILSQSDQTDALSLDFSTEGSLSTGSTNKTDSVDLGNSRTGFTFSAALTEAELTSLAAGTNVSRALITTDHFGTNFDVLSEKSTLNLTGGTLKKGGVIYSVTTGGTTTYYSLDDVTSNTKYVTVNNNAEALELQADTAYLVLGGTAKSGASIKTLSYLATGAAVPEPTTATLSLLALAGLAARRRRK